MTASKFRAGDKIKTKTGDAGVIIQVNLSGTAALVETGEDETFATSWYSTDSLSSTRKSPKPAPADPPADPHEA